VSSSRRSRKTRKFLLLPVRTPSAFLQAFGLPAAEMRGPEAEASRRSPHFCKLRERRGKSEKTRNDRERKRTQLRAEYWG
jgi:hypothetical protein